jgi:hypothetical protein
VNGIQQVDMIAAQHFWFQTKDRDLLAICRRTGAKKKVPRDRLAKLDLMARGLLGSSDTEQLVKDGLVSENKPLLSDPPRIGLVVTVRNPPSEFQEFLKIHGNSFCSRIYVFLDDPEEALELPEGLEHVVKVVRQQEKDEENEVYQKNAPFFGQEVMARQLWNAERALKYAAEDELDWLFHLDEDEILVLPSGASTLATVPDEVGVVVVLNDEVAVTRKEYDCYFSQEKQFKRNPLLLSRSEHNSVKKDLARNWIFTAYVNGKSGVRVGKEAHPICVHRFEGPKDAKKKALLPGARVLHFANCGYSNFLRKYQLRKSMSDKYFEKRKRISFHLAARDALLQGGDAGLEEFFNTHVYFADTDLAQLRQTGIVEEWNIDQLQYSDKIQF